jgi:hypothetical protein
MFPNIPLVTLMERSLYVADTTDESKCVTFCTEIVKTDPQIGGNKHYLNQYDDESISTYTDQYGNNDNSPDTNTYDARINNSRDAFDPSPTLKIVLQDRYDFKKFQSIDLNNLNVVRREVPTNADMSDSLIDNID